MRVVGKILHSVRSVAGVDEVLLSRLCRSARVQFAEAHCSGESVKLRQRIAVKYLIIIIFAGIVGIDAVCNVKIVLSGLSSLSGSGSDCNAVNARTTVAVLAGTVSGLYRC